MTLKRSSTESGPGQRVPLWLMVSLWGMFLVYLMCLEDSGAEFQSGS